MTPTIIVFKDGMKENIFKAGLDLLLPASLEDIQNAIDEAKKAGAF